MILGNRKVIKRNARWLLRLTALCISTLHLTHAQSGASYETVISQGNALIHADFARAAYDLTGEGTTVAVISDSFNCLGGADEGQANGELPPAVTVLKEANCQNEKPLDEGRAMLEVIHDLAPNAKLLFHAMGDNADDFTQALNRVAEHGAQIIVDDAVYFTEPMFQDSAATQTIDRLVFERGIAFFTSAGNAGLNSYQSAFVDSGTYPLSEKHGVAHDFNLDPRKADTCQTITVGADAFTVLSL
ncbi:hypothetical protein [Methylomonas koyamae]|uniref:hypothetical protein n=1 Tax=Methylomonas koyamae TaxID=702114 RepID=UPI00112BDC0C|nr:hypothetical protein [Methylomonas koyamae]